MSKVSSRQQFAKAAIDAAIHKAIAASGRKAGRVFAQMIWKVQQRSELLKPCRYVGRIGPGGAALIVDGVRALVGHRETWLRPVEEWGPDGSTPLGLFSSLSHHLLANYPVPDVLRSAWFRGCGGQGLRWQRAFRHVGMGGSLRTAGFPIALTKRMAHEFAHSPAQYPIEFALRWSQVRGLGGDAGLARAVASTRLGCSFADDEFWISVIHLFLNSTRLDLAHVGPIVDYLQARKYGPDVVIVGEETEVDLGAPEPDLSVKGRTVATLMRDVEQWRAERRPEVPQRRVIRWGRSGFNGFWRDHDGGVAWTIRELLDSEELAAEGKLMEHCVASYTGCCAQRRSSIWSLGSESPEGRRRYLTIEVDPLTKRVVQMSRKGNEEADEFSRRIVKDWADREGLDVQA